MHLTTALTDIGFELQGDNVYIGSAPESPVFKFTKAWRLTGVLWVSGERLEGEFCICQEPGTGNVCQAFAKKEGSWQVQEF